MSAAEHSTGGTQRIMPLSSNCPRAWPLYKFSAGPPTKGSLRSAMNCTAPMSLASTNNWPLSHRRRSEDSSEAASISVRLDNTICAWLHACSSRANPSH
ncbi:hypothetical protein D3C85_1729800 [compost metagenome]